jgi:ribose transport system ATP-binding protein
MNDIIRMEGISKSFPGVKALQGIDFSVKPACVHALIGENGAGKSTLIKILMGVYGNKYEGIIYIDGIETEITNPIQAKELGLLAIYQDIMMASHLTVGENFFLGRLPKKGPFVDWQKVYNDTGKILNDLGIAVDPRKKLGDLTVAQQEMVAIAKAVSEDAKLVIFDEPTALLTDKDTQMLFSIIRQLKAKGLGVVYISHRLEELFEICDEVTVLKDGCFAGHKMISETNSDELVSMMVGREMTDMYAIESVTLGETALEIKGLTKTGVFENISFSVRRGEILGMFGLVGSGRTDIVRAIFGAEKYDAGNVIVNGKEVVIKTPSDAIDLGIGLLPEDRREQGLCLHLSVKHNINLVSYVDMSKLGHIDLKTERDNAEKYRDAIGIKTPTLEQLVRNLSGGNQQKVVVSKWLCKESDILIFDEPTVGIDVNTKREIYKLLESLTHQGDAIILVSSYLPEVLGIADRVCVFSEGRLVGEITSDELKNTPLHELEKKAVFMASGIA